MKALRKASISFGAVDSELVERSAPGAAPSAFRIWKAGENRCDDGSIFFTEKSAESLIAEQGDRARVYSFDFDHRSLSDGPATSGRAAGYHALEVRRDAGGNSELWAVDIDWCEDTKAGLEAQPPHWKYFSPAFFTNEDSEVTSYINCAICINPLTHELPALASEGPVSSLSKTKVTNMDLKALITALSECSDEDRAALRAAFGEDDSDDKKDKDEDKEEAKAESDDSDDKKDEDDKEEKSLKTHSATVEVLRENAALKARLDARDKAEAIASRKDFTPATVKWLKSQPLATVVSYIASEPVRSDIPSTPTQGDSTQAKTSVDAEFEQGWGIRKESAPVGLGAPVNGIRRLSFGKGA